MDWVHVYHLQDHVMIGSANWLAYDLIEVSLILELNALILFLNKYNIN